MTYFTKSILASTFIGTSLIFAGCADAASSTETGPNAEQTAQAEVPNWEIIADASHIRFTAKQEGEDFTGQFGEFSGSIQFDPDAPEAGSVKIEIPLASIDAGSKDRNSTLPGKVWFSTKKFPMAVFTTDDISRDGESFLAKGELTLKGKSVPIELPFNLELDGDQAIMTSDFVMDRTLWNVGADPWDTDEWVSKKVVLDLKVTAKTKN